ncbi:putative V-type proton ATPase subunit H [Blattamonas nauphoetae]|uniref:V-type proton ATPase subunit H n=1 Tax=Blattamonas nauphoetae TaxID=2049346 RepID=A0ABQ9YKD0_9EUKA|nr:putative V-type proton ATPase subunit H [Blattamonas nauphoetae]
MDPSQQSASPIITANGISNIASIRDAIPKWNDLARASVLTNDAAKTMTSFTPELLKQKPGDYFPIFFSLLKQRSVVDMVKYVLTITDDYCQESSEQAQEFRRQLEDTSNGDNSSILLALLDSTDVYIISRVCSIYFQVFHTADTLPSTLLDPFFHQLKAHLRKAGEEDILVVYIHALGQLLRVLRVRYLFVQSGGLEMICPFLITKHSNIQILYETLYCIWLCTYNSSTIEMSKDARDQRDIAALFHHTPQADLLDPQTASKGEVSPLLASPLSLIPSIIQILKTHTKDKVVRLALSILRNLLTPSLSSNVSVHNASQILIENNAMKVMHHLLSQKWRDDDLIDNLQWVCDHLNKAEDDLCSMDAYIAELASHRLSWSPPHTTDKFWKENYHRFEAEDYQLIRELLAFLYTQDKQTIAIACRDIGNIAVFHPRGRVILDKFDVKPKIMPLLSDEDPIVQKEALLCIQKLLTQKWGSLQALDGAQSRQDKQKQQQQQSVSSAMKNPLAIIVRE